MKSDSISFRTSFFFKFVLAILGPLNFHINFRNSMPISIKMSSGILIGIVLNLSIILGWINIWTILSLLIQARWTRAAIKKHYTLGGLNNRNFSQFWRLGSPRCQLGSFILRPFLLAYRQLSSGYVLTWLLSAYTRERERERSGVSSHVDTNPIRSGLSKLMTSFNLFFFFFQLTRKLVISEIYILK